MKMRRRWAFHGFCLLALAGGVTVAVLERQAVAREEIERGELAQENAEAERLQRDNASLPRLRASEEEVKRLREGKRELARLRREVEQARTQAAEATALRAENKRRAANGASSADTDAWPRGFIARAQLADAGLETPEATVQTFFHAMAEGDIRRFMQCQAGAPQLDPALEQSQSESLRRDFAACPGFGIAEETNISPDEVEIGVQAASGGVVLPLHLVRVGNEWRVK